MAVEYHPLAAKPAFEMASPSGWPLDVCTCQPSRSISRVPEAGLSAAPTLVLTVTLRLWPCTEPVSCTPLRELHEVNAANAAATTPVLIKSLRFIIFLASLCSAFSKSFGIYPEAIATVVLRFVSRQS
jgi:hypothetical protein